MNAYENVGNATAAETWPDVERDRRHLHGVTSGVGVPLLQAFVTGISLAGAVCAFCWLFKVSDFWKWGIVTLASVQALSWLVLLSKWLRLVEPVERLLNVDLNNDGSIGTPEPRHLKLELKHSPSRTQFLDLPYAERLPDFFRSIEGGAPLSESAWCGAGALFSKREFYTLRDELLKGGVIRFRNENAPAQGLTLTPSGKAVARYIAGSPTEDD